MNVIDHRLAKLFFSCREKKNHSGGQSNGKEVVHCWWEVLENEERQDNQADQIESIVVEDGECRCFKIGYFVLSSENTARNKDIVMDRPGDQPHLPIVALFLTRALVVAQQFADFAIDCLFALLRDPIRKEGCSTGIGAVILLLVFQDEFHISIG